jgi:polyhydroxyalkanoate synthase subunit PhaC
VEYGAVSFRDRNLGMEHWIEEVVPTAIREVSQHAGGRPVHVVGWSLGGVFALLAAAGDASLPIASITALGSPFDVREVPMVAPLRPLLNFTDGRGAITRLYQAAGGAPQPLVRWAFQLSSFQKLVTKPLAMARNLDDADYLAQIEAVDRFTANMIAYPGRTFGQLYHRMLKHNQLRTGKVSLGTHEIDLAAITVPVLVFAGNTDGIAPIPAVKAILPLLSSAAEVRFEIVPGGHLGMLTGRAARRTTWVVLDEWIARHSTPDDREQPVVAPKRTPRKAAAKTAAKKTAAKKTAKSATRKPAKKTSKKSTTKATTTAARTTRKAASPSTPKTSAAPAAATADVAPDRGAIGSNPERRFTSDASRGLARKR